jgi:methionyl-tRNA synthetase
LRELTSASLAELRATGGITIREERVPYSTRFDQPIVGSLVGGTCPVCGVTDAGGFHCEQCGAENSPEDLRQVCSEIPGDQWEWRRFRSAFLTIEDPDELRAWLEEKRVDPALLGIVHRHLERSGARVRISHPGRWGIPCDLPGVSPGSVVFSYSALHTLSKLCGEIGAELLGESIDPFQHPSSVVTVKSFGFDNCIPYFVSVMAQSLAVPGSRPFCEFLTNHFCTLDDEKFSTSRGHAIWANDAAAQLRTDTDVLRLYLLASVPRLAPFNFSRQRFFAFRDYLAPRLSRIKIQAAAAAGGPLAPADRQRFHRLLVEQRECFDLERLDLMRAADGVLDWIAYGVAEPQTCAWTRAFAVLACPFMPRLCGWLWRATGLTGSPDVNRVESTDVDLAAV